VFFWDSACARTGFNEQKSAREYSWVVSSDCKYNLGVCGPFRVWDRRVSDSVLMRDSEHARKSFTVNNEHECAQVHVGCMERDRLSHEPVGEELHLISLILMTFTDACASSASYMTMSIPFLF
jgi:hypothetical protein